MTYRCLIKGILIQFPAATAAKGTNRPINGGRFCNNNNNGSNSK